MKAEIVLAEKQRDIFDRLKEDEPIRLNDAEYAKMQAVVDRTIKLSSQLNAAGNVSDVREYLSAIIGKPIDESTTIFAPF